MPKPTVLIVHGMGQVDEEEFKNAFIADLKSTFSSYTKVKGADPTDFANFEVIYYSDIFDEHREQLADRARDLEERLSSLGDLDRNWVEEAAREISRVETEIDDDDFFKTHFLDVIYYRYTMLGERVRIRAAKKIAEAIQTHDAGSQGVHIIAHSLGTSVTHDTLANVYTGGVENEHLSAQGHKLASVHFIANVSRILESAVNVRQSVVKPGEYGCTNVFWQYRHEFDPFTLPRFFKPKRGEHWISDDLWDDGNYRLFEFSNILGDKSHPHALCHFIANPDVHQSIIEQVLGQSLDSNEKTAAAEAYDEASLSQRYEEFKDKFGDASISELGSLKDLYDAAKELVDFVEDFETDCGRQDADDNAQEGEENED